MFANSGGLPIVVNKQLIGAVGVGGSAPSRPVWSDEICAHKALVEVIGPSVAPLVEDLPPRPNPNPGNAPVARFAAATPPKSSLPAEFVVGGKGAANVFDGNQISLAAAKKIARSLPRLGSVEGRYDVASTSSTTPASSCTWSAWTAKSTTTSAPRC